MANYPFLGTLFYSSVIYSSTVFAVNLYYYDEFDFIGLLTTSNLLMTVGGSMILSDLYRVAIGLDLLYLSDSVIKVSDYILIKTYIIENSTYFNSIYYKFFFNVSTMGNLFFNTVSQNLSDFRNSDLMNIFKEFGVFFGFTNDSIIGIFHNLYSFQDRFSNSNTEFITNRFGGFRDYVWYHPLAQPASHANVIKAFRYIVNYDMITSFGNQGSLFYNSSRISEFLTPGSLITSAEERISDICKLITKTTLSPTEFLDEFTNYYRQCIDPKDHCPDLSKFLSDWQVFSHNQGISNTEHINKLLQIDTSCHTSSKGGDGLSGNSFYKRFNLNPAIKSQLIAFLKDIDRATEGIKNNATSYKFIKVNLHNMPSSRPFTIASICMEDSTHRLLVNSVTSSDGWLVK